MRADAGASARGGLGVFSHSLFSRGKECKIHLNRFNGFKK